MIKIKDLRGITISNVEDDKNNFEFVFHIKHQYDYRFRGIKRNDILKCCKYAFFMLTNENLPIYGVDSNDLSKFEQTKKEYKNDKDTMPD